MLTSTAAKTAIMVRRICCSPSFARSPLSKVIIPVRRTIPIIITGVRKNERMECLNASTAAFP